MEGIDYDAARFWWEVAMTLGMIFNIAYQYVTSKSKANRSAIDRVDNRVSELTDRVRTLEGDVRHLPDHDDLGAIHEKVNLVANGMEAIRGELAAVNRTMQLINEHLLNGGGSRK